MLDDLSLNEVKEVGDVMGGLLGQIGLIRNTALIGSFLGVCILCSMAATGMVGLEIFILLSMPLATVPIILAYSNRKKQKKEELKEKIYVKKETKNMEGTEWAKWFLVIILFIGIILCLWAVVMIGRADYRPELLAHPAYKGEMILSGITGLAMIFSFFIAGLIISHKEEKAKKRARGEK